jgi:hypothetical protein
MILFTSDLLFGSKILGAAKYAGVRGQGELALGESADDLLDAALGHPRLRVFVFAGHLQTEALKRATAKIAASGASGHEVHSRGSLNARLSSILPPNTPAATESR